MKKKQIKNTEAQTDEEIAKAFSNKRHWSNQYLLPIFIGAVTIGMLLFLIFGGLVKCGSSINSDSNDETTLIKEYSFAEGSLPNGMSYVPVLSESERFTEYNPVCFAFENINSGLLLSSFSYNQKLTISLTIDSLTYSSAMAIGDETTNYLVSFYNNKNEEIDVQSFVDVSLGNTKISSARSDISSVLIKYVNPIRMSMSTCGYANISSISLYGVK